MTNTPRFLIVEARFYEDLADTLYQGASDHLSEHGIDHDRLSVPGAFEIPAAIAIAHDAIKTGKGPAYDGYIALGCVIRGETTHYDYVCTESARGLQQLALEEKLAIGYGILTTETKDQAWARADLNKGNKGRDAAEACRQMMLLKQQFGVC